MRSSFLSWFLRLTPGVIAGCVVASTGCSRHESNSAAPAGSSSAAVASAAAPAASTPSPIPQQVIDAMVNPSHLPAYDGQTGSVEGTIYVIGPSAPDVKVDSTRCPAAIDTYGKLFREGTPPNPGEARPLGDAVVAIFGYGGYYLPEKSPAAQVQAGVACGYATRTLAITFGQRIEVTNQSKYPFAPMLEGDSSPAVMMAAPLGAGDPIKLYPRRPGHLAMGDLMQPYVREDLYVLRNPLHAVSGLDGHYRIDGVPVGKLTVGAQHPTVASEAKAPVEVLPNVVTKVDITLEYAPKAAKADATKHDMMFR
jgi:hypothetical protein